MSTLREAFIETLKDTYDAEHQILKALPKVIKNVKNEELKEALQSHLEETEEHTKRLEQVFEMFEQSPKKKKCNGMAGLITEGQEVLDEKEGEAALILALQKVEHYEIAAYGALVSWANILEETEAANVLEETLNEEKHADEKLNDISEEINSQEDNEDESEQRKAA
jgi:ferritin-like metal-binding protein YciE